MQILQTVGLAILVALGLLGLVIGGIRVTRIIREFRKELSVKDESEDASPDPTPSPPDDPPVNNTRHETKRISKAVVWITLIGLYALLEVLAFFLRGQDSKVGAESFSWSWFFGLMPIFHLLLSLRSVGTQELGATFFFGQPIEEVSPGLVLAPWPFVSLKTDPRTIIPMEIPGEPEDVQKDNEDRIEQGKKAPVRIVHSPPETAVYYIETTGSDGRSTFTTKTWGELSKAEQSAIRDDPLNRRLATEVSTLLRFRIRPGYYIQFLQVIEDVDKAKRQLEDTVVATEQSELGKITASHAVVRLSHLNQLIKRAVEVLTGEEPRGDGKYNLSWGVDVETVQIKLIDTGKTVNTALAKASAAGFLKHETITGAEAEREKRILEGEGLAKARQLLLEAEAIGAAKLAEVAGTEAGKLTLALQTMRDALEHSNYSIVPSEGFLGALSAVQETLGKVKSPPSRITVVDR